MPSRRSKVSINSSTRSRTLDSTAENDRSTSTRPQIHSTCVTSPAALTILTPTPPLTWPQNIPYLPHPIVSPYLPNSHQKWLHTRPQLADDIPVITLPYSPEDVASRVKIHVINDPEHPAFGQRGLFAARDLLPDELIVGYFGYVHGGTESERKEWERRTRAAEIGDRELSCENGREDGSSSALSSHAHLGAPEPELLSYPNCERKSITATTAHDLSLIGTWDTSSYDLNMHRTEDTEIAVDAALMGNEARFVNDYRGVPAQQREAGETEKDRRGKRRVKGWDSGEQGSGGSVAGHGGSYGHRHDIAMPNAEFRDVWFDVPEHLDLTLPIMMSGPGHSPDHHDSASANDSNINDTITSLLTNLHSANNTSITSNPTTADTNQNLDSKPLRRKKKTGVRGVAVFVMPAGKAGKRKGGIKKGQEVLVSYGKGFWAHHGDRS